MAQLDAATQAKVTEHKAKKKLLDLRLLQKQKMMQGKIQAHEFKHEKRWVNLLFTALAEKEEVAKLEFDLQKRGPSMRPLTADAVVSCMSPAEAYDWLHEVEFKRERDTEGNVLSVESCRAQFLRDQRALLNEQRPEYDATGAMRHEIYEVLLHFHADSIEETKWPADGKAFARMRHVVELLKMRAQLKYVPRDELEVTHEMQRFLFSDKWAHSAVITPAHTMHSCLSKFAGELGVPLASLLGPCVFELESPARLSAEEPSAVLPLPRRESGKWLHWNNRLRSSGSALGSNTTDEQRRKRLLLLALEMGAKQDVMNKNGKTAAAMMNPVRTSVQLFRMVLELSFFWLESRRRRGRSRHGRRRARYLHRGYATNQ